MDLSCIFKAENSICFPYVARTQLKKYLHMFSSFQNDNFTFMYSQYRFFVVIAICPVLTYTCPFGGGGVNFVLLSPRFSLNSRKLRHVQQRSFQYHKTDNFYEGI